MAEAIGVASGVAGLLSLTIKVIGISYKYIREVHSASKSVQRFVKELEDTKIVLLKIDQISQGTDDRDIFGDDGSCFLSLKDSYEYTRLLETINQDLEARLGDHSFRKKWKALTWPFSEERTRTLIDSLHRHLENFRTALAIDNLTVGKLTLTEVRHSVDAQKSNDSGAILDWLSPLNMYQKQQDTLSRRHTVGTGKTIMTSIVVDHLTKRYGDEDIRVAYIYCDYKDQAKQTASNLIACLARQLIGRSKKLPLQLYNLYEESELQKRKPDLEELKILLISLCNERERTFILVDALDECEAIYERRRLLPLLNSLPHGSTRLFVTSRPNNEDIHSVFRDAVQINISAPDYDINRFVTETMEGRKEFMDRLTPQLKEQIVTTVSSRASGMFLLAALQIDRICIARTKRQIKTALSSMPREIDDLYRETVVRIRKQPGEDGDLGMRVLSWVVHAHRLLSVDEIRHGLAVEYDQGEGESNTLDLDNVLPPDSLVDVCAGLVMIDPESQTVRLVHYTAQEFFDKERSHLFEGTNADIAQACLTYLSYDNFLVGDDMRLTQRELLETLVTHPFLTYASVNWLSHVNNCHQAVDNNPIFPQAVAYAKHSGRLHFCAMLWEALSPGSARVTNSSNEYASNPLETASKQGLQDFVLFLLRYTRWTYNELNGSLYSASSRGYVDTARLLIEYGADVCIRAHDGSTALHGACKGGHMDTAKALLLHGPSLINLRDRWMWTPLHHAAHRGHFNLVEYLIDNGAESNTQTPLGLTACHLAAARGSLLSLRSIFKQDPVRSLAFKTREGRTPLHSAAQSGQIEAIRMLLQLGSDTLATDQYGETPRNLLRHHDASLVDAVFFPYEQAALQGRHPPRSEAYSEYSETFDHPKTETNVSKEPMILSEFDPGPADFSADFFRRPNKDTPTPSIGLVPPTSPEIDDSIPFLRLLSPTPPNDKDDDTSIKASADVA